MLENKKIEENISQENLKENISEEKISAEPVKEKILRGSYNLPKKIPNEPYKNIRQKAEQEKFLGFISEGMTEKDSMHLCQISYTKVRHWKLHDKEFLKDLWMAEQSFKLQHVRNISAASERDWKASKFLLERKFPAEFGERSFQQVEQVGGDKEAKFVSNLLTQILSAVTGQEPTATLAKPPHPVIPLSDPFTWGEGTDEDEEGAEQALDVEDPEDYYGGDYNEDIDIDIDGDFDDGI